MAVYKTFSALMVGLLAMFHALPAALGTATAAACLLLITDTITGIAVAFCRRDLATNRLRRVIVKIFQYSAIIALAGAVGILTGSYLWVQIAMWCVCSTEACSIIENVVKLERHGVNLGYFRPLFQKIGTYLSNTDTHAGGNIVSAPGGNTENPKN